MTCDNCAKLKEQVRIAQAEASEIRKIFSRYKQYHDDGPDTPECNAQKLTMRRISEDIARVSGPGAKLLAAFEALKREHGTVQRFFETDGSLQMAMEIEHDAAEKALREMEGNPNA